MSFHTLKLAMSRTPEARDVRCNFFRLAPELHNRIYDLLISSTFATAPTDLLELVSAPATFSDAKNLLLINRQIFTEANKVYAHAYKIFLATTDFTITLYKAPAADCHYRWYRSVLSEKDLETITRLRIHVPDLSILPDARNLPNPAEHIKLLHVITSFHRVCGFEIGDHDSITVKRQADGTWWGTNSDGKVDEDFEGIFEISGTEFARQAMAGGSTCLNFKANVTWKPVAEQKPEAGKKMEGLTVLEIAMVIGSAVIVV